MAEFVMSETIQAAPAEVFAVFTDLRGAPGRVSGIKKIEVLTDGPIRAGTRFRETRIMFNRECTEQMEITEFSPGRSYTVSCLSCGAEMVWQFRFTPVQNATRVDMVIRSRPIGLLAKLMTPLAALMFKPMMKKCMTRDIAELKAAIEGGPAPACSMTG